MTKINEVIDWLYNIKLEQIIDIWIAIAIVMVFRIFRAKLAYIVIKMFKFKERNKNKIKKNAFYEPLKSFFGFLGLYLAILFLCEPFNISEDIVAGVTKGFKLLIIITTAIGINKSITVNSSFIEKIKEKSNKHIDESTINIIIKIIRAVVYIIAGFMVITELGYNLNGLVAGLGIGSLVITLAAQDTAKNLFGGIMIFIERPFSIGDSIKVNNKYEGKVEDISIRSTRLRTADNSVLYVPNSEIANTSIVNNSQRVKRIYKNSLILEEDTPLIKIETTKNNLIKMLLRNEKTIKDSIIVNFAEITNDGITISIEFAVDTTDNSEYLAIKEEINYNIMQILAEENVNLANDTQTIHIKN